MTDVQNMSKIQIRAYVLQLLLPFKSSAIPRDFEVEKCIDELSKINDCGFIITLLLKEISGTGSVYDNVIVLILYFLRWNASLCRVNSFPLRIYDHGEASIEAVSSKRLVFMTIF